MASPSCNQSGQATAVLELLELVLDQAAGVSEKAASGEKNAPSERVGQLANRRVRAWIRKHFGDSAATQDGNLVNVLDVVVARLDLLLQRQLNAILHHPRFQRLEASWRGLHLLWDQAQEEVLRAERAGRQLQVRIRVLSVSQRELFQDADGAIEFDQTEIWKKVYEMEFGVAGGAPFGALVADYEFANRPDHMFLLSSLAQLGAASFAPILTAAAPRLVDPLLDDFAGLHPGQTLSHLERSPDYINWRAFRAHPDSRFVGLFLPRVLMRLPHGGIVNAGFPFQEDVKGPDRSKYVWGNAAFAFGCVLIRAFGQCGWFADIRGCERGVDGAGLVPSLPVEFFATDMRGVCEKTPLDLKLDVHLESHLSQMGFVPISACHGSGLTVFHTNQSTHRPTMSTDMDRTANERISAMLQYALCVGRFAHYIKSMGRRLLGSQQDPAEIQTSLRRWISRFVSEESADAEFKAKHPLRLAEIDVLEEEGDIATGDLRLIMRLAPHYQLDSLAASVRLQTTLVRRG